MGAKKKYIGETQEEKKARLKKYQADYYRTHKEERKAYVRKWKEENKELSRAYDKKYYSKYYQTHRNEIREKRNAKRTAELVHGMMIREKADILDALINDGVVSGEIVKAYKAKIAGGV